MKNNNSLITITSKLKKLLLILLLIYIVFFLSGCWNYSEVDKRGIVLGMAIDRDVANDKYDITVETAQMSMSGKDAVIESRLIEIDGDTLFDAIRNAISISSKKLYWGHAKVVIIGQDTAKEGINPIIDWIHRDSEARMNINLLVSKEKKARDVLYQKSIVTPLRSLEIDYMTRSQEDLSTSISGEVYKFFDELSSEGISATLPMVGVIINAGDPTSKLSQTAVFNEDRYLGSLSEDETKYFLFVRNKIKGGLLVLTHKVSGKDIDITFEILKNKTKIKPEYNNGKLSIKIDVDTEAALVEHKAVEQHTHLDDLKSLQKYEKQIEEKIKHTISTVQEDYGTDIFGFGRIIKAEMPDLWKDIHNNWKDVFKQMDVVVKSTLKIRNTGLSSKSIKIGD